MSLIASMIAVPSFGSTMSDSTYGVVVVVSSSWRLRSARGSPRPSPSATRCRAELAVLGAVSARVTTR